MALARSLILIFWTFSFAAAVQLDMVAVRGRYPFGKQLETGISGNESLTLENQGDLLYFCNINLGGDSFQVLVDTGSWDLWVFGDVPGTKDLGISTNLTYGMGTVQGSINTAQLELDGFPVQDQAYLNVDQKYFGWDGMIGLGPSTTSHIRNSIFQSNQSSNGLPVLDRIFRENSTVPNHLTFLLSRDKSTEGVRTLDQFPAQLTIGTVIPGLEAVLDAPKLPVIRDEFGVQHWQSLLDPNGIIGPDGQRISTTTSVPNPSAGSTDQLHVMFDTGFTVPQLPGDVVDAIYGRIPGAEFIEDGTTLHPSITYVNFWRIPCSYEVNVSFVFASQEFPIAPLDLSRDTEQIDSNGQKICIAFFQQTADGIAGNKAFGALDMFLGMAFLRNVYTLINFGNFVDGSADSVADPYIQLLSLSDKSKIHNEFVNARLGGQDTTGSQAPLLDNIPAHPHTMGNRGNSSNQGSGTGSNENDGDDDSSNGSLMHKPALFASEMSVFGFLILGVWLDFS